MKTDFSFNIDDLINLTELKKLPDFNKENLLFELSNKDYLKNLGDGKYQYNMNDHFKAFVLLNFPSHYKKEHIVKVYDFKDNLSEIRLFKSSIFWYLSSSNNDVIGIIENKLQTIKIKEIENIANYDVLTKSGITNILKKKISQAEYQKEINGLKGNQTTQNPSNLGVSPNKMSWRKKSDAEVVNSNTPTKTSIIDNNSNDFKRGRFYSSYQDKDKTNSFNPNQQKPKSDSNVNNFTIFYTNLDKGDFSYSTIPIEKIKEEDQTDIKAYSLNNLLSFCESEYNSFKMNIKVKADHESYRTLLNDCKDKMTLLSKTIKRERAFTEVIGDQLPVRFDYSGKC